MRIRGTARVDKRTKDLVKRLSHNDIAIISHNDLDDVAAHSLVNSQVKAVINARPSLSNYYPNPGPQTIISKGMPLLDNAGENILDIIEEGQEIEIVDNNIYYGGKLVASGHLLTLDEIKAHMDRVKGKMGDVISKFAQNTMDYAKQEIGLISGEFAPPETVVDFKGRHTLIVVRGKNYKEDLNAIKSYIDEVKPVLIGVDGGADALQEFGYKPDIIIGDMDSVSDSTLSCGAELIVHAYPNGNAPGLDRIEKLGLKSKLFPAPGTSEDIAMLLAYDKGTELIVAVGAHSNIHDFLEKGRKGMASTFLVRLKVGDILVDAKGVSKLYHNTLRPKHLAQIVLAALIPVCIIMLVTPSTRQLLRLIYLQFRVLLGI